MGELLGFCDTTCSLSFGFQEKCSIGWGEGKEEGGRVGGSVDEEYLTLANL